MANLLTRKQFAALINKSPNYVGMYTKNPRKKIIEENKRIDTDNPINRAFIAKYSGTQTPVATPTTDNKQSKPNDSGDNEINQGNIDYIKAQHDLKLKITKLKSDRLDLKKKQSKIVPVDFMTENFGMYVKTNINEVLNNGNKLIDKLADELSGNYELKLKYKKELKGMINDTFKKNHEALTNDIIEKAKKYSTDTKW